MAVVQKLTKRQRHSSNLPKVKKGKRVKTHESKQAVPRKPTLEGTHGSTSKNPEKPLRKKRAIVDIPSSTREKAREIKSNLSSSTPSIIKEMCPSHVSGGFWLGLPKTFCVEHFPDSDTTIILEDESGNEYATKYLHSKTGLSGGWRSFSLAHKLIVGDVLVFQLVQPSKFKVYIVRSHSPNEVDAAFGLLGLERCRKQDIDVLPQQNYPNSCETICEAAISPSDEPEATAEGYEAAISPLDEPEMTPEGHEDFGPEVLGGIRIAESMLTFNEVTSIENFSIQVNGLVIDSEIPKHLKIKYYELCCSQGMFLHVNLLQGLNCTFVTGMIFETINIADAIRASKVTTSQESFATWYRTLRSFEALRMNIGFLLSRLKQLMKLSLNSQKYEDLKLERHQAEQEKKVLQDKILEVEKSIDKLNAKIDSLNCENWEDAFEELAKSPW